MGDLIKSRPLLLLIAFLLPAGGAYSPAQAARPPAAESSGRAPAPKVGLTVPDIVFTDLSGRAHRLSEFTGRYVLLDFWATWCGPCIEEFPTLKKAAEDFQPRGLVLVGMNSDKKAEVAQRFVREHQIPWVQSSPQSTLEILRCALKIRWYPALVLLNPQRKIILVSGDGTEALEGVRLLAALDRLLPARRAADGARRDSIRSAIVESEHMGLKFKEGFERERWMIFLGAGS